MEKQKKKQKPKAGHVIRVSDLAFNFLNENEHGNIKETMDHLVGEVISLRDHYDSYKRARALYLLPESNVICTSLEEARGEAILRGVRKGKKKEYERPIKVKVVE